MIGAEYTHFIRFVVVGGEYQSCSYNLISLSLQLAFFGGSLIIVRHFFAAADVAFGLLVQIESKAEMKNINRE